MGMLARIKKRQFDGFKDFVMNMETAGPVSRGQIFMAGVLEDPVFMEWVMKNVKSFDDILKIPGEEIEKVLMVQDQMIGIFAKCIFDKGPEFIQTFDTTIPRFFSKLKDEISYINEVLPTDKEAARIYILKATRKLQIEERIIGLPWIMPSPNIFHTKVPKDGPEQIFFDNGVLAAAGENFKGKKTGTWKHYYETGKILAEGDWFDGLKISHWKFYYSSGSPKSEGKYKLDLKNGTWKEWDRNGVVSQAEFKEGVKV